MILFRFNYIKRQFPKDLEFFEANEQIILVELLRAKIILKKDISLLNDVDIGIEARLDTIKKIENTLIKSEQFHLPGAKEIQSGRMELEIILVDATEQRTSLAVSLSPG